MDVSNDMPQIQANQTHQTQNREVEVVKGVEIKVPRLYHIDTHKTFHEVIIHKEKLSEEVYPLYYSAVVNGKIETRVKYRKRIEYFEINVVDNELTIRWDTYDGYDFHRAEGYTLYLDTLTLCDWFKPHIGDRDYICVRVTNEEIVRLLESIYHLMIGKANRVVLPKSVNYKLWGARWEKEHDP